ncbi:MAG TPA: ferritin-like fold-containing protein [Nitriliruptorales bacterium]
MKDERELATVELLGALTYAQLRAFEVTARAVRVAPDARAADRVAEFASREHAAYVTLRDHLVSLTDLGVPVIDRQKARVDDYFDRVPTGESWVGACAFFATGLPLVSDFVDGLAPVLDDATAQVVVSVLADRSAFHEYATEELAGMMIDDPEVTDEVRHLVADLTGRALTQFQGAIADTDALEVLLRTGDDDADAGRVRNMAITVLDGHRRRMHALGIQDPE